MAASIEPTREWHGVPQTVPERHLEPVADPAADDDTETVEQRLARRIVVGTLVVCPAVTLVYVLLVALALRNSDTGLTGPLLMGAGIGVFAAIFWGLWIGIASSVREIEAAEHRARMRPRR